MLKQKTVFILFASVVLLNLIFLAFYSLDLRPSADDYCFGATAAEHGFWGGYIHWLETWTGYLYPFIVMHLTVGMPLGYLSDSFISSIPFLFSILMVGLTVYVFLNSGVRSVIKHQVLFILYMAFIWWVFTWFGVSIDLFNFQTYQMAQGLTHWQNLNGGFFSILLLINISVLYLTKIDRINGYVAAIIVALIGFLVGTSGSALSLSVALLAGFVFVYFVLTGYRVKRLNLYYLILVVLLSISIILGVYVSHNTPGHLARASLINADTSFGLGRVFEAFFYVVKNTIVNFARLSLNIGFIFIIASLFLTLKYFTNKSEVSLKKSYFLKVAILTFAFSLLLTIVNVFAEYLTYSGYWHFSLANFFLFLSAIFFSVYIYLSFELKEIKYRWGALFVILILATYTNFSAISSISDRHQKWINGPASHSGVSDVDDPNGWQRSCWNNLIEHRLAPLDRVKELDN